MLRPMSALAFDTAVENGFTTAALSVDAFNANARLDFDQRQAK